MKIATPLKKVTLLFPSNPPLKVEVLSSPPPLVFESLVGGSTPTAERGGVHTMYFKVMDFSKIILVFTSNGQGVVGSIQFKQHHRKFIKFNHFMAQSQIFLQPKQTLTKRH